jgi:hypothetical protein
MYTLIIGSKEEEKKVFERRKAEKTRNKNSTFHSVNLILYVRFGGANFAYSKHIVLITMGKRKDCLQNQQQQVKSFFPFFPSFHHFTAILSIFPTSTIYKWIRFAN